MISERLSLVVEMLGCHTTFYGTENVGCQSRLIDKVLYLLKPFKGCVLSSDVLNVELHIMAIDEFK